MKLNLKMIAVAAAIASLAGASQAALTTGTVDDGSLALVAYNSATEAWYVRDLGYTINAFLPTGTVVPGNNGTVTGADKTPTTGLTINGTGAGSGTVVTKSNFSDSAFSTWYAGQGANATERQANVKWLVGAYDNRTTTIGATPRSIARMVVSSASNSETFLNGNIDFFTPSASFGGLAGFLPSGLSSSGTGIPTLAYGTDRDYGSGVVLGTVGSASYLYYAARSVNAGAGTDTASAVTTAFGNAAGLATITLSANGDLVYTLGAESAPSAVPVPAAVWLLGSGLMALGGAARRRRAAAKA